MGSLSRTFAVSRLRLALVGVSLGGLTMLASAEELPQSSSKERPTPAFRHIQYLDEDELLKQLAAMPEIAFNETDKDEKALRTALHKYSAEPTNVPKTLAEQHYSQFRPDPISPTQKERWKALGIQVIDGDATKSSPEATKLMAVLAPALRVAKVVSTPNRAGEMDDAQPGSDRLPPFRFKSDDREGAEKPSIVPTLMQMLQPERGGTRALLVRELSRIQTEPATIALARIAIFDASPMNRERALEELKGRPIETVRKVLFEGLRHPWPLAAEHAAEALVALKDREALPDLRKLLDEPSPTAPFTPEGEKQPQVRELVRVNHLKNCFLCHAPSASRLDLLTGLVPLPGEALRVSYYSTLRRQPDDILARADVVYVRQDFSVMLPVENAKPWPSRQRFDFVVRTRPATEEEVAAAKKKQAIDSPQWEAVMYAMRELKALSEAELTADRP